MMETWREASIRTKEAGFNLIEGTSVREAVSTVAVGIVEVISATEEVVSSQLLAKIANLALCKLNRTRELHFKKSEEGHRGLKEARDS
jgi:hypothetical protein